MQPIGWVRGGRTEATKDGWGDNRCRIELDTARFTAAALRGLDQLSHLEVIWYFHIGAAEPAEFGSRHPRGRRDWPCVGIFAQRGRMRPNRIAVSVCCIVAVDGTAVEVEGLDAVDGSPVLDLKPVWSGNLPAGPLREPGWAQEIMQRYWSSP